MINEVLLTGDNKSLVSDVVTLLKNYVCFENLKFSILESTDPPTLKADQAFVLLCNSNKLIKDINDKLKPQKVSYATSSPNSILISNLNNVDIIGSQRHLNSTDMNSSNLNLGMIKNNVDLTEPSIRESDLFLLDLNILRSSEVQNASFSQPSGLFTEDITQMSRYAGMTEQNKYFFINNASVEYTQLLAQLIWYYAEAGSIRFPDHPYFSNTVEEYAVQVTSFDTMLSFYKSKSSGRWWVKIPNIQDNKWKSCAYDDYLLACNDDLSPELLQIIANSE